MRQLTSLDAQFLAIEDDRQTGHVAGLAVVDPSTTATGRLELADLQQLLEQRQPLLPPLRWRLAEVPLGLDYPYWVEDERFDLDFHVRELALPAPGSDQQLAEQVARIVGRPLDRARPLWELYLIQGLADDRVALLTKIHHAVIDGVSGAEITGLLLDLSPEIRQVEAPARRPRLERPSDLGMLARGLLGIPRYPLRALRSLPTAIPNLEESQISSLPGVAAVGRTIGRLEALVRRDGNRMVRTGLRAPRTPFSGRVSPHRRFAFGQLDLDRIKRVKAAYGVTVNDVVVAMCAAAVRRWLVEHDALPDEPLVAQIPVSVRTQEQVGTYGNRILLLGAPLHTEEPDPVRRLERTHEDLQVMKERHQALPAELLQDVNHFFPPAVFSRAARLSLAVGSAAGRPTWNLVVSNVPGPQLPLYFAGAKLLAHYPVSVVTDGMGMNITVMSYNGHLDVGVVADREQVPDVWCIVEWLEAALTELEQATLAPESVSAPS